MKLTGLVSGNSLRNKIGSEVCQVGHPRKDWSLGTNLSMWHSNPEEGVFDWTYWDQVFDKADANGIKLLCRPTTDTHTHAWKTTVPLWIQNDASLYIQASNNPENDPQGQSRTTRVPRYANARVRANRKKFMEAFRDRYKDRPSYWKVDASLGGFSGEGHTGSHGYNNSQFDMRGSWRWDYLADYVEVFGAENVFMIANQDAEGIRRAVDLGIIYYRRDGVGAKYQQDELMTWVHNVPTFKEALQRGGFLGEPWDQLKGWPGNNDVQQDFMLTARQLVSLNCILFFNMDQEIPQQFIDNKFWPTLKAHFATVNDPSQPGDPDPPPGDGGGDGGDPVPGPVPVTVRVVGGYIRMIQTVPDEDPDWTDAMGVDVYTLTSEHAAKVSIGADDDRVDAFVQWIFPPGNPDGGDGLTEDADTFFRTDTRGTDITVRAIYEEPIPDPDPTDPVEPPEFVTRGAFELFKGELVKTLELVMADVGALEAKTAILETGKADVDQLQETRQFMGGINHRLSDLEVLTGTVADFLRKVADAMEEGV